MNYLILVNKDSSLNEEILDFKNCIIIKDFENGEDIYIEKKTYKCYLQLREELLKSNIDLAISSGYRSFIKQQDIIDRYIGIYGIDYVNQYVAKVGTSEHHTGLGLDIAIKYGDKYVFENEDLEKKKQEFVLIHSILHKHGFILRYPKQKEDITGYNYEPWHIRYVGKRVAKYIYDNSLTLEEYIKKGL